LVDLRGNVFPLNTSSGRRSSLRDNHGSIHEIMGDLSFTPIIGMECSIIARDETAAWRFIADEINRALYDKFVIQQEERSYITSLAEQKLVRYTMDDDDDALTTREHHPAQVHELRKALLRVGATGAHIFADGMKRTVAAPLDVRLIRVRPERHYPEMQEFREALVLACISAYELLEIQRGEDSELGPNLSAQGVYERLTELAAQIIGGWISSETRRWLRGQGKREALSAVLKRLNVSESADDEEEPMPPYIHLRQLEWIAQLIWYTLSYDAHAYRTNEELAFQLSLEERHFEERLTPADAAQLRGSLAGQRITAWFKEYVDSGSNEMRSFYDTIARVLATQYSVSLEPSTYRYPVEAVAISTTFDMEMEEALSRQNLSMIHVAVPVRAYTAGEPREVHLRWLLGTSERDTVLMKPDWHWFPDDSHQQPDEIGGPLVIKLHGSPLHNLPDPAELGGSTAYRHLEHALTISESEHLENILLLDALPNFFKGIISDQRRTFFLLGQSVSDWNVKLRLFDVAYPDRVQVAANRRLIAVNERFDPYRTSVLDALRIDRWEGKLEDLASLINQESW
jgi:hypothetical protein